MENKPSTPAILLLHDGELEDIADPIELIGGINRRGGLTEADRNATWDLVLGTSQRMLDLHTILPATNATQIAVVDGDSKTLRRMLRRSGIDLLVRRPVHPASLRLLILDAILAELSTTGCSLMVPPGTHSARPDGNLTLLIPPELNGGRAFSVGGQVARITEAESGSDAIAVTFGSLRTKARKGLETIVAAHSHGPAMLDEDVALAVQSVPTFSDSAEPTPPEPEDLNRAEIAPAEPPGTDSTAGREQRGEPRRALSRRIIALGNEAARVLIGRDLSVGGMRIDRTPGLGVGDMLRVALHVRPDGQPLVLSARVRRDDGDAGLALRFVDLNPAARLCLEEMVDALPAIVESNDSDTGAGMVVSEVVGRRAS
jgi:hypothetical protein